MEINPDLINQKVEKYYIVDVSKISQIAIDEFSNFRYGVEFFLLSDFVKFVAKYANSHSDGTWRCWYADKYTRSVSFDELIEFFSDYVEKGDVNEK